MLENLVSFSHKIIIILLLAHKKCKDKIQKALSWISNSMKQQRRRIICMNLVDDVELYSNIIYTSEIILLLIMKRKFIMFILCFER